MPETESSKYIYSNTWKYIFTETIFGSQMRNVLFLFEIKEVLKALAHQHWCGRREEGGRDMYLT